MSDRFSAGRVHFRSVGGAIGDDFADFSAQFLKARNKFARGAIASRKKYTFPAQLECKLVDQSRCGSALADVSDLETGELRRIGCGFANGCDSGSGQQITEIYPEQRETVGDCGNCVLASEN